MITTKHFMLIKFIIGFLFLIVGSFFLNEIVGAVFIGIFSGLTFSLILTIMTFISSRNNEYYNIDNNHNFKGYTTLMLSKILVSIVIGVSSVFFINLNSDISKLVGWGLFTVPYSIMADLLINIIFQDCISNQKIDFI